MPFISPDPVMPPDLEGFPWKDLLHLWDMGMGYSYEGTRIKLWYPCDPGTVSPQVYASEAWKLHMAVWNWLADRYEITKLPEFDSEGNAFLDSYGKQQYSHVACWGTFHYGRKLEAA